MSATGTRSAPRWPDSPASSGSLAERLGLIAVAAVVALAGLVYLTGQLAGLLFGAGWPAVGFAEIGGVLVRLPAALDDPAAAWPAAARNGLPGAAGMYASAGVLAVALAAVAYAATRATGVIRERAGGGRPGRSARWATRTQLRPLLVRDAQRGRLTLGRAHGRLLAAEPRQSVVVIAPTQSLKTTGLAVPALLEWQGPVLAVSVKSDLLHDTLARRRQLGRVFVYDPTGATGIPSSGWSPLTGATTWQGAQRVASWLTGAAAPTRGGLADADFWYAAAAKLLAPILLAAATSDRTMADVVRWVDTQEQEEVKEGLLAAEVEEALIAAEATW